MMRYQRKFIHVDHVNIAYVDLNTDKEDTILFIHGNSNSADLWYSQLSCSLFSNYRLVAADLPGHGRSSAASSYSILFFGKLMAQFAKKALPGRNITLVGLSLGGNIVAEMATTIPALKGMAIISSAIVGDEITPADIPTSQLVASVLFSDGATSAEINQYFNSVLHNDNESQRKMLLQDYENVSSEFRQQYPLTIQKGAYSNEISLVRDADIPVLFITGKKDDVIPPDLLMKVPLPLWKQKHHRFEQSGHFVNLDETEGFNELLHQYLSAIHSHL